MPVQDTCALSKPEPQQQLPPGVASNPQIKIDPKSYSLSLDSQKNNCHPPEPPEAAADDLGICPQPVGHFRGVKSVGKSKHVGVRVNIACKGWQCPHCGPLKVKRLRQRIYNGSISQPYVKKGLRRSKYELKFLTLTAPGREYREAHTPAEASREMNRNLHKLMRALRKKNGDFMYLKVVEAHKDGFPHFHVLIVGPGIAPKSVLDDIRNLWVHKYGMGNFDIKVIQKGIKAAIKYLTAYITKDIKPIYRGARVFSSSRDALEPLPPKPVWIESKFYLGVVRATKEGKAEVLEAEFWPDMPENPEWWRFEEGFREEIDEFVHLVLCDPVLPASQIGVGEGECR